MTATEAPPAVGPTRTRWGSLVPEPPGQERWFARLAPFIGLLIAVLLVVKGQYVLAGILVVAVFALLQARLVSPRFAARFDRALGRVAHVVGTAAAAAVSWLLLTVVFVLFFLPAALLGPPLRWLAGRSSSLGGDGWLPRVRLRGDRPARTFGAEPRPGGSSRAPRLVVALAAVAALVIVDLTAGAILTGTGILPPKGRGDVQEQIRGAIDATLGAPAMDGAPWALDFGEAMADFELGGASYQPYIVRAFREFHSPYLNVTAEERVSYQAAPVPGEEPLRVAFLGGSVMFGVGQRDEHTIPSEVARIAEAEGVPLEVHNYGFPGYVTWQEMQYLERRLSDGNQFDLVVFLDGFNDFEVQAYNFSTDPTFNGASVIQGFISQFHDEHQTTPGYLDGLDELAAAYRRNSAIARVWDEVRGREYTLPGADDVAHGTPEEQTDAALDIYDRAHGMVDDLTARYGTSTTYFWQPRLAGWDAAITDRLPDGVVNLAHLFDGQEDQLYIDEVHTNEDGAHQIAQAMWDEIGPELSGP